MTDRPTTAAGRALLHYAANIERALHPVRRQPTVAHVCPAPDACDLILEMPMHVLAIEAEARQPDSEVLRQDQLIADLTWALSRHENALLFGTLESPHEIAETLVADIVKARAALPPSAPPALDADRLAEALKPVTRAAWSSEPKESQEQWRRRTADAIAAEYARLASQPPAEPTDPHDR